LRYCGHQDECQSAENLLTEMNAPVAFTGFLVALLILSEGWAPESGIK
jgi:Ca2+/H+ antiporter